MMASKNNDDDSISVHILVPRLPPVSAHFLARASLILINPSNTMYDSMNQFFLRLTDNHGAFKDSAGLPAFISLFCSSSDKLDQSRKERIWALSLLKDGVSDGYDYKVASRRHVPTLLLTSFETLSRRKENADLFEMEALLQAILALVNNGGRIAYSHMVEKVGLLSWIRGVLLSTEISSSLPTVSIRTLFLNLISGAINAFFNATITDIKKSTDLSHEALYLVKPVIRLFISTVNSMLPDIKKESNQLQVLFCNSISLLKKTAEFSSHEDHFSFNGTNVNLIHELLTFKWTQKETMLNVVASLVRFPFCIRDEDCKIVRLTCSMLLRILLDFPSGTIRPIFCVILQRVDMMHQFFEIEEGGDECIFPLLLALRKKSLLCGGYEIWKQCIFNLVDNKKQCKEEETFFQLIKEDKKRKSNFELKEPNKKRSAII